MYIIYQLFFQKLRNIFCSIHTIHSEQNICSNEEVTKEHNVSTQQIRLQEEYHPRKKSRNKEQIREKQIVKKQTIKEAIHPYRKKSSTPKTVTQKKKKKKIDATEIRTPLQHLTQFLSLLNKNMHFSEGGRCYVR